MMGIERIGVVGAGQMGNGIAHVCALAGYEVLITDISEDALGAALSTVGKNMDRQVSKGLIEEAQKDEALRRTHPIRLPFRSPGWPRAPIGQKNSWAFIS